MSKECRCLSSSQHTETKQVEGKVYVHLMIGAEEERGCRYLCNNFHQWRQSGPKEGDIPATAAPVFILRMGGRV